MGIFTSLKLTQHDDKCYDAYDQTYYIDDYAKLLVTSAPSIETNKKTDGGKYPQGLQQEIEQEANKCAAICAKGHAAKQE